MATGSIPAYAYISKLLPHLSGGKQQEAQAHEALLPETLKFEGSEDAVSQPCSRVVPREL